MSMSSSSKAPSTKKKAPSGKRILLVEDEPSALRLFSEILKKEGHEVVESTNGEEAMDQVKGNTPQHVDLLVSDLVMPGVGGLELASQFRQVFPDTKILLLSGYTEDVVILEERLSQDTHFLPKPFRAETFRSKIQELLAGT